MARKYFLNNLLAFAALLTVCVSGVSNAGDWLVFRHDSAHTGRTDVEGPSTSAVDWQSAISSSGNSSPLVAGDRIYVTTGTRLVALDLSGNELWSVICPTLGKSSPAVSAEGNIYVAATTAQGTAYLCAYKPDGSSLWPKKSLPASTEASPTFSPDGSTLYIGCSNGDFCAYYTSNGNLKFTKFRAGGAIASSAAVDSDGAIFFGCDDGYLYALSSLWQLKWKVLTYPSTISKKHPIKSSPSVDSDGTVYVTTMGGGLQAINPSGSEKWRFLTNTGSEIVSSPALGADGSVYFGCRDKCIYSVNSSGELNWKREVGQAIDSSPALDSRGIVYFGSGDGSVYAFESDGDLLWSMYLGGAITSSPAIGDPGALYVAGNTGFLYKFYNALVPPTTPVVFDDGLYSTLPSSLHASWISTDERSGIAKYEIAIGTSPGSNDLVPFTDAGLATQITVDNLSLVNGATYYFSVRATNNDGLISDTGVSDGVKVDFTPPVTPLVVDDGSFTGSADTLHAVYSSGDVESGIDHYEYSVGTSPGSQDILGWSSAGLVKEQTISGLNLSHAVTSYINIRAYNCAGLVSEGSSNGILVDFTSPVVESVSPVMTSSEVRVRINGADPESGITEVKCILLPSPQLPDGPNWILGGSGADIVIPGPFDPLKTYYVAAMVKNGVDKWSEAVISSGIHLDNTPPVTPVVVDDGAFQCNNNTIHATWSSSDLESGIHHYSYCAGTMPGLANLINWTDTTETSFSRSGLLLTNGGTHYITVRAINGVGLVSAEGYSDGITVDITPSAKPVVTDDGQFTSLSDSLHATWLAADPESGIVDYSYCVGTAPGTSDIASWTTSSGANSATVYDLVLDPNLTYYFSVKARNGGGCWSETASSDGIRYIPGISVWPKFRGDNRNSGCSNLNGCITGRLRWQVQTQGYVESSPAVGSDGTVYIGASDGRLYAINSNATVRWMFQTGACIESSPAIGSDGCIYIGSHDGCLYCVYPNGTQKWKYSAGDMIWSSPSIGSDGTIYFGCHDNYLYALHPDGQLKWRYKSGGAIWSSPAVTDDGTIYFGCGDSKLYAIKPDGTLKWKFVTGSAIDSSPAVDKSGVIYFGSGDGYFYALNPNGTLWWKFHTGRVTDSSPVITPDGRLCFGTGAIGTAGELYSLTLTGQMIWRLELPGGVRSSPVSDATGTIYVGSADGTIFAIAPDGSTLWSYHTGQSILGSPAIIADGSVVIGSDDGVVYSFRDFGGIDTTGPSEPRVRIAKPYITPDTPISASWIATDLESGLQGYSYAIGTSPGASDLLGWTYVGPATSIKQAGLSLQRARTYYVSVVANNHASLQSPVGVSSGITVVSDNPLNTIGATKERAQGTRVYLPGKVITAVFQDYLFIEEVDRSSGIRCLAIPAGLVAGNVVNVLGTVSVRNGEVVLTDTVIELCGFSVDIRPLIISGRSITLNSLSPWGMLVKVTGTVKSMGSSGVVLSDGSGRDVTVLLPGQTAGVGDYLSVSGILCIEIVDTKPATVLRPVGANPVQTY